MCGSSVHVTNNMITDHCGAAEASGSSTCKRGSVQIPLGGTDHTLSADPGLRPSPLRPREFPTSQRTSSGRVRSGPVREVEFGTAPTRLCRWSGVVASFLNSTTRTHGLCSRPGQTKSVHVETEQTSQRPDGGLVGDPSGPWVWSGRVPVVEFRNDTTRPDQRQSSASIVIWT